MRFVIQRVNHANVKIDGEVVGNIGQVKSKFVCKFIFQLY